MWEIVSLTGGFVMLILGAGYLVDNASALASKLGIPNLVIGLTIVAFGTSAPELVVSIISSMKGNSEITIGNIAGSNIFNILVILGISALISPLRVKSTTTWFEVPLCVFSALLALILAYSGAGDNSGYKLISRTDGYILLMIFMVFIFYNFHLSWKEKPAEEIEVRKRRLKDGRRWCLSLHTCYTLYILFFDYEKI